MAGQKLRVGIAGYGIVGKRRRQFIDINPNMVTVAVSDINFGQEGFTADSIKCYPTYQGLFNEKLDVLFVSLPNYLAAEATIAGLKRGLHVFCEKPPGRDVKDIEDVIEMEKKRPGLVLKYGFNHRYHDSVREALRIISAGELGEIINVRGAYGKSRVTPFSGNWRSERKYAGGGILLDQGIHIVDLMRLFCGEFEDVKSYVSNSYWKHDVEDNVYALMRDGKGRIAMLHSSATQWRHRFQLEIILTDGFLQLNGILSGTKSYGEEKLIIGRRDEADVGTLSEETVNYLEDNSWRDEVNEFADVVCNGDGIKAGNSSDALATMQLVYQIYYADSEWRNAYNIKKYK